MVDLARFRLVAAPPEPGKRSDRPRDLTTNVAIADLGGDVWFVLKLGHHALDGEAATLRADFMDIYGGPALVSATGLDAVAGLNFGTAALTASVLEAELAGARLTKGLCRDPVWPDGEQHLVDLLMISTSDHSTRDVADELAQFRSVGRARGEVFVTPTALFQIVGDADVPWYFRYVTPETDADCLDDGRGQCQPYGESQGGYLVWNLYHLRADGLLVQVARSGVKHAFNSVNVASVDPNLTCACPGSSRVAFSGCVDLYSAGTNANPRWLGPRSEIEAATVSWEACGSIFDRDCDGTCDVPGNFTYGTCLADNTDPVPFMTAIDEATLASDDAVFLETWYLVRDDVDVFNSMGNVPLARELVGSRETGLWNFEPAAPFATGAVVQRLAAEAGREPEVIDGGAGRVLLDARAEALGDGWTRFVYLLMNVDFDPRIASATIALAPGTRVRDIVYLDGDDDPANDWQVKQTSELLLLKAPPGGARDWGTMATISFAVDQPAGIGGIALGVDEPVDRDRLFGTGPRPVPDAAYLHGSGFEG